MDNDPIYKMTDIAGTYVYDPDYVSEVDWKEYGGEADQN